MNVVIYARFSSHSQTEQSIEGQLKVCNEFHIPPYTPEMNPIEQIWKEIRKRGFRNEVFASLDKVVDRLCDTICSLSNDAISSITGRNWIIKCFN